VRERGEHMVTAAHLHVLAQRRFGAASERPHGKP